MGAKRGGICVESRKNSSGELFQESYSLDFEELDFGN